MRWRTCLLALAMSAAALPGLAATRCEIPGDAVHWAYDACMGRFETDDGLHPGVMKCADRAQALVRRIGSCPAKRVFKGRMCAAQQRTESRRRSYRACMTDPAVTGSTVEHGGL
jgi:hypothetical protein